MDVITIEFVIGDQPTECEHCGSTRLRDIGLVAPKCQDCGKFTVSHIQPREE